jgi:hypothetical protein
MVTILPTIIMVMADTGTDTTMDIGTDIMVVVAILHVIRPEVCMARERRSPPPKVEAPVISAAVMTLQAPHSTAMEGQPKETGMNGQGQPRFTHEVQHPVAQPISEVPINRVKQQTGYLPTRKNTATQDPHPIGRPPISVQQARTAPRHSASNRHHVTAVLKTHNPPSAVMHRTTHHLHIANPGQARNI